MTEAPSPCLIGMCRARLRTAAMIANVNRAGRGSKAQEEVEYWPTIAMSRSMDGERAGTRNDTAGTTFPTPPHGSATTVSGCVPQSSPICQAKRHRDVIKPIRGLNE